MDEYILNYYANPFHDRLDVVNRYCMTKSFKKLRNELFHHNVRGDDIWVITFP